MPPALPGWSSPSMATPALVLTLADPDAAAEWFDREAAAGECRGRIDRGPAQRNAYVELCREVEAGRL